MCVGFCVSAAAVGSHKWGTWCGKAAGARVGLTFRLATELGRFEGQTGRVGNAPRTKKETMTFRAGEGETGQRIHPQPSFEATGRESRRSLSVCN